MTIKHIFQPINSKSCGQHCVQMITGKSIDEIYGIFGHSNATTAKMIFSALSTCNIKTKNVRMKAVTKYNLPEFGIVNMYFDNSKMGHWVVLSEGIFYDPSLGVYPVSEMDILKKDCGAFLSSFLEIS